MNGISEIHPCSSALGSRGCCSLSHLCRVRTWRKTTPEKICKLLDSDPEPSCCKVTVLTTAPLHHPHMKAYIWITSNLMCNRQINDPITSNFDHKCHKFEETLHIPRNRYICRCWVRDHFPACLPCVYELADLWAHTCERQTTSSVSEISFPVGSASAAGQNWIRREVITTMFKSWLLIMIIIHLTR